MVVLVNTGIPKAFNEAIQKAVEEGRFKSSYMFVQIAIKEKLERDGWLSDEEITYIHYQCRFCKRDIYVLPDVAGLHEWLYCTPCGKSRRDDAMIRMETVLGKDIPPNGERKWSTNGHF